ncbi:MAG: putative permease [Osedax symbiont Rs1]|nr:MAG: putative permease [Osedax symbiont Rs1]
MLEQLTNYLLQPTTQIMLANTVSMFVTLFTELSILFIAISLLVAVINQRLPAEKIQRLLGGKNGRGYVTAAALGAITPFCSCSTIPMLIGMLKARAGFGPTMTFLFTSPLLNPIVIALFIRVLGIKTTIAYAVLALSVAIFAGALLSSLGFERYIKQQMLAIKKSPSVLKNPATSAGKTDGKAINWRNAWFESWSLFKSMFPYMLIAMLIGAVVHGFVPVGFFSSIASADNPLAVPSAALIGIPLYIRVSALLPLVGSFVAKGVSIGAVIALIIGSGGASLPELILLNRLFYWPLLLAFIAVIFCMAIIGGYSFNYFLT